MECDDIFLQCGNVFLTRAGRKTADTTSFQPVSMLITCQNYFVNLIRKKTVSSPELGHAVAFNAKYKRTKRQACHPSLV